MKIDLLSIIIPIFCEEENISPLYDKLIITLNSLGIDFEIIIVDDGSTDGSANVIRELAAKDKRVRFVRFSTNFGQTAAIMAGIDHSKGDVLIPIDGDLQNDPADIPRLLDKLSEGYDVVSGWRRDRKDDLSSRVWPSRIANILISYISGVKLNDFGCTLKVYRRAVLEGMRLYGEMHRFIPIFAVWNGGTVTELPVAHHPRRHGMSKYGMGRVLKVILDLFVVKFLTSYHTKPIYVFGLFGLIMFFASFVFLAMMLYYRYVEIIFYHQTPLPILCVMSFSTGIICILLGLIAELLIRVYYEAQGKRTYAVGETVNLG